MEIPVTAAASGIVAEILCAPGQLVSPGQALCTHPRLSYVRKFILAVNGTLMRGLELNPNMLAAGAEFIREDRTVPVYRLLFH